jgi:hypothetical protein
VRPEWAWAVGVDSGGVIGRVGTGRMGSGPVRRNGAGKAEARRWEVEPGLAWLVGIGEARMAAGRPVGLVRRGLDCRAGRIRIGSGSSESGESRRGEECRRVEGAGWQVLGRGGRGEAGVAGLVAVGRPGRRQGRQVGDEERRSGQTCRARADGGRGSRGSLDWGCLVVYPHGRSQELRFLKMGIGMLGRTRSRKQCAPAVVRTFSVQT